MSIFNKTDKVLLWKYITKSIKVLIPNSTNIDIPVERLTGFSIEENYEDYYFPVIKVNLVLDVDVYYKILENKNNCSLYLRIDKFFTEPGKTDPSLCKKYINDSFMIIMDENTEDMLRSVKEDQNEDNYKERVKSVYGGLDEKNNANIEFYIFKPIVDNTKKNINKILTNANVSDAVAYIATVGNINNIIMAQPDNTTVYNQLLLPPLSIIKSLEFIDFYYGLYKKGSLIWFGLDNTYIVPYSGECVAYERDEVKNTTIIIPKSINTNYSNTLGNLVKISDKTNNYIIGDHNTISISNQSISNNYLNANTLQVVDSYNEEFNTTNSSAKSKNQNFVKYFENNTENSFVSEMYSAQSNAKSDIISIRLQNFDVSNISPNKKFNIIFEDKKYTKEYSGKYILAAVTHNFLSEGADFMVDSVIVLRKS